MVRGREGLLLPEPVLERDYRVHKLGRFESLAHPDKAPLLKTHVGSLMNPEDDAAMRPVSATPGRVQPREIGNVRTVQDAVLGGGERQLLFVR